MPNFNKIIAKFSEGKRLSTLFIFSFVSFGLTLILVSTIMTINRETTLLKNILIEKNKQTVGFLVEALSNALVTNDISFLQVVGERLTKRSNDILYYVITNDKGKVETVNFSDDVTAVHKPDFLESLPPSHIYYSLDYQRNVVEISSQFKVPYYRKWRLYVGFSLHQIIYLKRRIIEHNLILAVLYTIFSILAAWGLAGFVLNPIYLFQKALDSVIKHETVREVNIVSSQEINSLARSVNEISEKWKDDYDKLKKTTDELEKSNDALVEEKEQNEEELRIANRVQMGLLQKDLPPLDHVDTYGGCQPAASVGGDFFQLRLLDNNKKLQLVVGDVTGHGVSAALMMAMANSIITEKSRFTSDPALIIRRSDESIRDLMPNFESFITVFLGVLDLDTFVLTYTSAGHNPAIILKHDKNDCSFLNIESLYLNCPFPGEYENHTLRMERGDIFFVYTDGIPEARDVNHDFFTIEKMSDYIVEHRNLTCKNIVQSIFRYVLDFTDKGILQDDITAVTIKLK